MTEPLMPEKDLWLSLRQEDSHAIQTLYKSCYRIWISWMTQRGGEQMDGEDVFQEALMVIISKAKDEAFTLSSRINTLLIAICKNLWYKRLQRQPQHQNIDEHEDWMKADDSVEAVKEFVEKEAQFDQMTEAMNHLGEPCSSLLKAFYIDNKSMQIIAEEFNYTSADNAKTQKYKCLNRLKKLFFGK